MNKNRVWQKPVAVVLVAALSLGSAGFASAQRHDNDRHDRNDRNDRYEQRSDRDHDHDRYDRRDQMRRGAGPNHDIYIGRRLPTQYRHNNYVVNDWRGQNLRQPPRGYHWVQSGSDYLLVAVATGLIASAILNN
jgi:Ni/Co efflux regulator RcnB